MRQFYKLSNFKLISARNSKFRSVLTLFYWSFKVENYIYINDPPKKDKDSKSPHNLHHSSHHLPKLVDKSTILREEHIKKLSANLIPRAIGYDWILSFSTEKNGFSLASLYRSLANVESPCLFVIKDKHHNVFGAMTVSRVYESKHKFFGNGESFLFTFTPKFKVFKWSGENRFFTRGLADGLAFGCSE